MARCFAGEVVTGFVERDTDWMAASEPPVGSTWNHILLEQQNRDSLTPGGDDGGDASEPAKADDGSRAVGLKGSSCVAYRFPVGGEKV